MICNKIRGSWRCTYQGLSERTCFKACSFVLIWEGTIYRLTDLNMRQFKSDELCGFDLSINEDTDILADKKAQNTLVQRINRNACNVAIGIDSILEPPNLPMITYGRFVPPAKKGIVVQTVECWGHEDGKITLSSPVKIYTNNAFSGVLPVHADSCDLLGHHYPVVSSMKAMRGNSPLLTREEKDERRVAKQGVMSVA